MALACLTPLAAFSQDFVAPTGKKRDIATGREELKPTIDGIVSQIFDVQKPWQLLNPLAPMSYGNGEKNVSKDPGVGTPHRSITLTIVGVEW